MTTHERLRAACEEAATRIDSERVERNAGFLRRVQEWPEEDRRSDEFLQRIWHMNPLDDTKKEYYFNSTAGQELRKAARTVEKLGDFRRQFLAWTSERLPDRPSERATRLDQIFENTRDLVRPLYDNHRIRSALALAALFPLDFIGVTTIVRDRRLASLGKFLKSLQVNVSVTKDKPARAALEIRQHLEQAIGAVDPSDWQSVARRMLLPEALVEMHDGPGFTGNGDEYPGPDPTDTPEIRPHPPPNGRPDLRRITEHFESIRKAGRLIFEPAMVESLHLGLWARERRHFAVLTGLSGTGKTRLAIEYAAALTGPDRRSHGRICTIAVQPGWHDPTPLLGYVDPLGANRYAGTEFLRFLIRANDDPALPHVCVLDEMNLSHPEQYLAPILSAMEMEDGAIDLHGGDADEYGVPNSIRYPDNLVLIGTVNMDETTMGISDKVLDRAFTLEFWDVDVARWPGWAASPLDAEPKARVRDVLDHMMRALGPARLHFGWRVIEEVARFMEQRQQQDARLSVDDALDRALYAKVLPKLRGEDAPRFRTALEACRAALRERNLARCTRKVAELMEDLEQTGSFRFWR